ncbi:MAG TPA: hypothetical protein VKR38_08540, partial [Usitatibacter sp.]|nr:hypothetical protein [Usitatibacter sp.]
MAEARVGLHRRLRLAAWLVATAVALFASTCVSAFPPLNNSDVLVEEWVNDITGHYFLAADSNDANALESGAAGPGWHRTPNSFHAYTTASQLGTPIYRFYGAGPNSHFYTGEAGELAAVRDPNSGWFDEGVKFGAELPVSGACPEGAPVAIHRLYNNREAFNDAAHRYVFDAAVLAQMVAAGWSDEGVHLCSSSASSLPDKAYTFQAQGAGIKPLSDCKDASLTQASCIAMDHAPSALMTRLDRCANPSDNCAVLNPYWTSDFNTLTGTPDGIGETLFTTQAPYNSALILGHTYISESGEYLGAHVTWRDAQASVAAIEARYQMPVDPPAAGADDSRLFPWRNAPGGYIALTFALQPKTVVGTGSGAAFVEFRDSTSGDSILMSMLAYGTFDP